MTKYGIRMVQGGLGPWVELTKGLRGIGGVIVFDDKPTAREYASRIGIRGEILPYDEDQPTVTATKSHRGWDYK